jgi:hypothetical protein
MYVFFKFSLLEKIIIFSFIVFGFSFYGCGSNGFVDEGNMKGEVSVVDEEGVKGKAEVEPVVKSLEEEALDISGVTIDMVSAEASSMLVDDSNIGFNYEASMVLDQDFSTAWCPKTATGESISLSLPLLKDARLVGAVSGYGRDETIFFQNDRIKTMEVQFLRSEEVVKKEEVVLDDVYGIQFVDLPKVSFSKVNFKIVDV